MGIPVKQVGKVASDSQGLKDKVWDSWPGAGLVDPGAGGTSRSRGGGVFSATRRERGSSSLCSIGSCQ